MSLLETSKQFWIDIGARISHPLIFDQLCQCASPPRTPQGTEDLLKLNGFLFDRTDGQMANIVECDRLYRIEQLAPVLSDQMEYKLESDSVIVCDKETFLLMVKSE